MEKLKHLKLMTTEKPRLLSDLTFSNKLLNGFATRPALPRQLREGSLKLQCSKFLADISILQQDR